MKKLNLMLLMLTLSSMAFTQTRYNLGGGYYGENATYPGLVAEFELERMQSERFSTTFRSNLGFYNHPRSHNAIFVETLLGTRRYLDSGIFLEHALGLGIMFSFYPEDVWHVGDDGSIVSVSKWANPDFSPSVTLGVGYDLGKGTETKKLIWMRPKISWQMPYNNLAQPHLALQVGFTKTFRTK